VIQPHEVAGGFALVVFCFVPEEVVVQKLHRQMHGGANRLPSRCLPAAILVTILGVHNLQPDRLLLREGLFQVLALQLLPYVEAAVAVTGRGELAAMALFEVRKREAGTMLAVAEQVLVHFVPGTGQRRQVQALGLLAGLHQAFSRIS
jgi:hypothetical protein